jgi:hemoglobin
MSDATRTLYDRLGGYDAIAAVASDLLPRLMADERLGRFWAHRGTDGIAREQQLLVDFLCAAAGGPMYYTGRDMKLSHAGMRITNADWAAFMGHVEATLDKFNLPPRERAEVLAFVESTHADIVEM